MNPLIPVEGGTFRIENGALIRVRAANAGLDTIASSDTVSDVPA